MFNIIKGQHLLVLVLGGFGREVKHVAEDVAWHMTELLQFIQALCDPLAASHIIKCTGSYRG